jgi:lysophospholipase L1-like esterase
MSESIAGGQTVDLPVRAGDSLKIGYLGGTYSAVAIAGLSGLPSALATNANTSQTLGPWARNIVVRLSTSANGRVEYAVGNPPVFAPAGTRFVRTSDGVPLELKGLGANAEYLAAGSSPTAPAALAASGSYSTSLTEGTRYESAAPTVTGGVAPYAFGSAGGRLPPGIRINPQSGVMHGVPSFQGSYAGVVVRAIDQLGAFIDMAVGTVAVAAPSTAPVVGNRLAVAGDSITQRSWDTAVGSATLAMAGGVCTVTLSADRTALMLPGQKIRLSLATNPTSLYNGEWAITAKTGVRTLTFDFPFAEAAPSGNWNCSFANAVATEGFVNHIMGTTGQRMALTKNIGCDGATAQQILAIMQARLAPGDCDVLCVMAGTNDINQSIPTATTIPFLQQIMDYAVTIAPLVVMICPPPTGTANGGPAALGNAIKSYASANYPTKISVIDAYELVREPGQTLAKTGYLIDNLHPSGNAAWVIGSAAGAAILAARPDLPARPTPATSFVTNGNLTAVTGSVADGVTAFPASSTMTPSIVANPYGPGNLQRYDVTATAAGRSRAEFPVAFGSLVTGKKYQAKARVILNATSATLTDLDLQITVTAGGQSYFLQAISTQTNTNAGGMGGTKRAYAELPNLVVITEPFVAPASITLVGFRFFLGFGGAGTGAYSFGEIDFFEVV